MARPVTIFIGQWADLGLEEIYRTVKDIGYEGLEIASWDQIDLQKAVEDPEYIRDLKGTLERYGFGCWTIGAYLPGQCVGDMWDPHLDGFVPVELAGKLDEIRVWSIQQLKYVAMAVETMGVGMATDFIGSPTWKARYPLPQTTGEMVEAGFQQIKGLRTLISDAFDKCGVKFALKVHLTEIAFGYYSTWKLLEVLECRETLGINFDPSHSIWQGMDPAMFLHDFIGRVYHVRIKDAAINLNGRNGVPGSHITFGDLRRDWNFVSPGHGDVDSGKIIRILNVERYDGPLSAEWEDSGMDRVLGGTEACALTKKINFSPSAIAPNGALEIK